MATSGNQPPESIEVAAERHHALPEAHPTRNLAVYQRFDTYLTELLTQLDQGRRYIIDQSFAVKRDPDHHTKVWRELATAKALFTRITNVIGGEWHLEDANPESAPLTAVVEHLLKRVGRFRESLMSLALACYSGGEWSRIYARREKLDPSGQGVPSLWWSPYRLKPMNRKRFHIEFKDVEYPDKSTRRHYYWAIVNPISKSTEILTPQELEEYVHHVWLDWEHAYGHGWGMSWAMAPYWEIKQTLLKYLATGLERFAWPWIIFKDSEHSNPANASIGTQHATNRKVFERIRKMRNSGVLWISDEDSIDVVDVGAQGNRLIMQAVDYLDKMIVEFILGSSAQTGGHGAQAQSGAYASDAIEAEASQAYIAYDRDSLEETITEQLIRRIVRNNANNLSALGMGEMEPPRFRLGRKKREDPATAIAELQGIRAAVPEWQFRRSQVVERTGWDFADDDDMARGDVIGGQMQQQPQDIMGLLGIPPEAGQEDEGLFAEIREAAYAQRFGTGSR